MSSTAPSPDSSNNSPPSPPLLPPTTTILPPVTSIPTGNTNPPPPQSTPPPVSSPSPPVNSAPPPVTLSPPPVDTSPPPVASSSPPPPVDNSPPPSTPTPVNTPPPTVSVSPPPVNPPPSSDNPSPPVAQTPPPTSPPSPPPPVVSPPAPPTKNQSPPPDSPSPPVATPPSPATSSSPPPPESVNSPPPSANSPPSVPSNSPPPPSKAKPPKHSRSPPPSVSLSPPPPGVQSTESPPPVGSPPDNSSPTPVNGTQSTPASPVPPSSTPPTVSPPSDNNTLSGSSIPSPPVPIKPVDSPSTSTNTTANSDSSGGMSQGGAVAIGIVSVLVVSLVLAFIFYQRQKKKKVSGYRAGHVMPSPLGSSPSSDASYIKAYSSAPLMGSSSNSDFVYSPSESGGLGNPRSTFTYEELSEATDGFSTENLLGEGGFGCVYKGVLPDGREVAVKQLKVGGSQGEREFSAEIETISRVHHRHLVSLVGYCISDHHRLLAYDFVANDTLYHHLHENEDAPLDWATRVKVATGAARGIAYLHEDCHPRIIHRDIKSSNILLDKNFDAQVSDFGLARLSLDVYTHVSTRVMGTFGYMAPEYASSGKLTDRSDVYSFGVVLLELITGRKPVDGSQPLGDESLVEWARPLMNNAIEKRDLEVLIDPKLGSNYIEPEMYRMIEAAAACVRHSATKRPRMGQVLRALDSISDDQDLTNGTRLGQSEVYDEGNQSAEIRMFQRMAFGTQDYSTSAFSRSSWGSIV